MPTNRKRKKKIHEYDPQTGKTIGDLRSESKSKEQMKKDFGPKRQTMKKRLR